MSGAPRIHDRSRCYPLDCRVGHRGGPCRTCERPEELIYIGWTRILDFACSTQYWTFLPEASARWLTAFFEALDRSGLADEEAQAGSWHPAEVTEHLGALAALVAEPPFELREVLELWDGPIPGGDELWELLDICRAHQACKATLIVRKWWHW